jgi:flagellar hook-length control protein FliK
VTAVAANADAGTSIVAVRDATPPATSTDAADRSRALLEVASVTASASPAAPSATSPAAPLHAAATPPNAFPAGSPAPADARLSAFPGSPDFAPQLGTQLTTFVREGVQHARLELNPAAMGPVTVQIQLDGQTAQVHLSADHAQTRQALEQAMPLLASGLREAGFTLGGGGVFEQPRQAPQGSAAPSGNGRRGRDGGLDGEREAETAALSATRPGRRRGVVDLVA